MAGAGVDSAAVYGNHTLVVTHPPLTPAGAPSKAVFGTATIVKGAPPVVGPVPNPKTWSLPVGLDGFRRTRPPVDTFPPTVPIILGLTAASSTALSLTFQKSTDAQSGVLEYVIKYRVHSVGSYVEHSRISDTGAATYTKAVDGLTASTSYDVVVSAIDASTNRNPSANSTASTASTQAGGGTAFDPDFPRVARVAIADPQTYPLSWASAYGRFDVIVMNGNWAGWAVGRGFTREAFVSAVKAATTAQDGTLVFQYTNGNEINPVDPPHPVWYTEVNARNGWVYNVGTAGTKTPSNFNATFYLVNYTDDAPLYAGGLRPYQYFASYWLSTFRLGTQDPNNAAPSLDGPFLDNCLIDPRVTGDWNRDGTPDSRATMQTSGKMQQGQKRFFDAIAAGSPAGKYLMGNIGDYGGTLSLGVMDQVLHGGLYESCIGQSFSLETYNSFAGVMLKYRKLIDFCRAPKLLVFGHRIPSNTSYAFARYGICACLMDDGYVSVNLASGYGGDPTTFAWFDELIGGTLNTRGFLGRPLDARQTLPRYQVEAGASGGGIWRRDFTNGIVLCAARRGIGTLTDFDQTTPYAAQALGGTFYPIDGVLDTTVNTGGAGVNSVTMVPRTGLILMRTQQ